MDINNLYNKVEAAAANNTVINENDYIKDGLYYCGNCHTPKQVEVEFLGVKKKPFCLCKCAAERKAAEDEAIKKQDFLYHVKRLRDSGFLEGDMKSWTFENDDGQNAKLTTVAKNYVENFKEMKDRGKGLLLFGGVGTGKTYAAACIANALIDKGRPCLMTNFARLSNTISGMYEGKQEYIDALNRYDLLVIDDLAAERNTEYMNEIVFNVIDSRYRSHKPLIVTTNLTSDEISKASETNRQRIFSRLYDMCIPFEVNGADRRRANLRNDYSELKSKLGL